MDQGSLYGENLAMIAELRPEKQWAGKQWVSECWEQCFHFRILEARRSEERQSQLIRQGRFTPQDFWVDVASGKMTKSTALRGIALVRQFGGIHGHKVTWTLDSEHLYGLACDIQLIDCSYADIDGVGKVYGIHRVPELIALGDLGHYTFRDAVHQPQTTVISADARIKALTRRLSLEKIPAVKTLIAAVLARLKARAEKDGTGV